jgi:hypothetical protein
MKQKLIKGIHYYLDANGLMVFTEKYHTERGHCCQSGCKHCPYDYHSKVDPSVPAELQSPWEDEEIEVYDGPIEE